MTQYGVEEPREAFVEFEDARATGHLETIKAVTMLRGRLGRSCETAETKGELSREDRATSARMQDSHEDGPQL